MNVKYKIIAVDFDGTLCENKWPEIGVPNLELIDYLRLQKAGGDVKLILWTCRTGDRLKDAVTFCLRYALVFDHVNENTPESKEMFGPDESRKIFAHEYIDDRSSTFTNLPFVAKQKLIVGEAKVVATGDVCKPYYQIEYFDTKRKEWCRGFGSYDLRNVKGWLEEELEILPVEDIKLKPKKLNNELLNQIEDILKITFTDFQRAYILETPTVLKPYMFGRGNGKTLSYQIKLLLGEDEKLGDVIDPYLESFIEETNPKYSREFANRLFDLYLKFLNAGIECRVVKAPPNYTRRPFMYAEQIYGKN